MSTYNYVGSTDLLYILQKLKNVLDTGYVAQVSGKGLSTEDFTTALLNKLNGIEAGAEVNVQADWSVSDTTSDAYIANKPQNLVTDANYVHTDNNFTSTLKTKLEGISAGANAVSASAELVTGTKVATITIDGTDVDIYAPTPQAVTFDTAMSDSSENGVQNKVIKSYVDSAISGVTQFDYQVVQSLPASGVKGTIYLVPNSGTGSNIYDEYVWIVNGGTGSFEKIGTTDIDLSGYVQDSDLVEITTSAIDTMFTNVFGS